MKEFSLSRKERLTKKKDFQTVYSAGRTIISNSRFFKAIFYLEHSEEESGIKVAFAVHKKSGNAVWRNKVRRLLREAFRSNKKILGGFPADQKMLLVFSNYSLNKKKHPKLKLNDLLPSVIELMNKIKAVI
ncbi:MAG: ribonuclease P protein component [Bacteroidetes bacterium]|nr:ribonuclease P protein component [Bacteroidota bacterium]MBU1678801.1 ribonuclease P protein component [Bacteroidota bacterium]MBU2507366.1 ribonuclease P protein component [Bacteroidota bacterium]